MSELEFDIPKAKTTKAKTKTGKTTKKKTPYSIVVTGDETSKAKGEEFSVKEFTELLKTGVSSKSKRKALVSFLKVLAVVDDKIISEMFFGNPIYKTWNYDKFKSIKGNRKVKDNKVEKLIAAIDEGMNLLPFCPVLVDRDFNVCDGQHRFESSKNSGRPVYYMIVDEMALEDIARMNSNSNSWTIGDYLNLYIQLDKADYKYLDKFATTHKLPVSTAMDLLSDSNEKRTDTTNKFKSGEFAIEEEQKTFANRVAKMITDFSQFDSSIAKKRAFVRTLMTLVRKENAKEDYSHTKMMTKMEENGRTTFVEQTNKEDYLRMLEGIYNYKLRSGKIRLY